MKDRVRENLGQVWRVKNMAALAGYSAATLHRQFVRYLGCSPLRWVAQQRLELAKQLLSTTRNSIRRVGEEVGMPDPFHFSRFFKAHTGLSPRAYRNKHNAW
ncbi:MAG: helix-turn-helix transcriptional regulator [Pseudopedobacter sp.]|nr:helix-turn-helix transcriptional regulator [Deinococcales bacterium]